MVVTVVALFNYKRPSVSVLWRFNTLGAPSLPVGSVMCGHSFHPRHAKTAYPGAPAFGRMDASGSISWSTPLAKTL
jgi:hypothetical protein